MTTRRWLVKTDPRLFSFADLASSSRTEWNGTRSPLALRHLGAMRRGDLVLVYHSGSERAVVGWARVARGPRPDTTVPGRPGWFVTLVPGKPLPRAVPRRELAADPALSTWALVRHPRLTVLPVPAAAWRRVMACSRRPAT